MVAAAAKEFRFLITVTVTGTLKGMKGRASLSLRYGTLFPVATTKPAGTLGDEKRGGVQYCTNSKVRKCFVGERCAARCWEECR